MTNEDAKKMLKAKLDCLIRETSGTDMDCNHKNCDECNLCYEQGNMGEQKEALELAIKALEQEPRKGHWIEYSWNDNGLARRGLECDKCHKKYKYGGEIWNNPNYCPNCGARMIESEELGGVVE